MNSKETYRLTTIFLYISFVFLFFQYTSSQPLSTNLLKTNINNNDDDAAAVTDSMWIQPLSYVDSDELNVEDNDPEKLLQLLYKFFVVYNGHDQNNQPSSSSFVRRANFWKRANFWRKRANFWRRDLAS